MKSSVQSGKYLIWVSPGNWFQTDHYSWGIILCVLNTWNPLLVSMIWVSIAECRQIKVHLLMESWLSVPRWFEGVVNCRLPQGRTPLRLFWSSLVIEPKFFFVWKLLEKMKNDTTFVRIRSGDHLGDAKMSKKGTCSVEFNFFIYCDRHKRFSQNEREGQTYKKVASDFLILPKDLVMVFQV